MVKILGIETSCDETSAAVVTDDRRILSNKVWTQLEEHRPYRGVVPEIAARAHILKIDQMIREALEEAQTDVQDLDAVAATAGPGLIGGLIVGVMTAKSIASAIGKPFIAVNHLEGHALTARLTDNVQFPYLLLLVSGGHCQILTVEGVGQYKILGGTLDDALGEAFDKTAKMLGLPYPGGPEVEKLARSGNPARFDLPRPLKGRPDCNFSFSGLKTAVRTIIAELSSPSAQDKADICASFQSCIAEILIDRLQNAIRQVPHIRTLVVAGGVAANQLMRASLQEFADKRKISLIVPPARLCTDNAAMIAWAGMEQFKQGNTHALDFAPRARWHLAV